MYCNCYNICLLSSQKKYRNEKEKRTNKAKERKDQITEVPL